MKSFKEIFSAIVDEVRKEYDPYGELAPYFQFGLYSDLIESLKVKENNQVGKYPLIWLVWENANNKQQWIDPNCYSISPRVFICDLAVQSESTDERYDNVFAKVIEPLYELLISEMGYSSELDFAFESSYNVNDIPDGKLDNESGSFDYISAKEINFQNLLIYKK